MREEIQPRQTLAMRYVVMTTNIFHLNAKISTIVMMMGAQAVVKLKMAGTVFIKDLQGPII